MSLRYSYNDNIGLETKFKEYKVFNFFPAGLKISNEDAELLIQNKKWIFNKNVMKNLNYILKIYLPKYCCAFLSNNNEQDSLLYFGVSDFGDIIGIPYDGVLDKKTIYDICKKIIATDIKSDVNILDYLNIEVIKLNYEHSKYSIKNIHPLYNEYLINLKEYKIKREKYLKKRYVWDKLNDRYNSKLCDLVNNSDTRLELIKFIEYIDFKNPVIKILKSNYILPETNMDDVRNLKIYNTNIYYWVTEWKDRMLGFLKKIKPRFYYRIPCHLYPLNIISHIKPMIPYWFEYSGINLYLIKITFKKNVNIDIEYKNIYNEWTKCIRYVNTAGPCCLHFY